MKHLKLFEDYSDNEEFESFVSERGGLDQILEDAIRDYKNSKDGQFRYDDDMGLNRLIIIPRYVFDKDFNEPYRDITSININFKKS